MDQAKADAEDFENGSYDAKLGANTDDLDAKLDDAKGKLGEIDGTHADPSVGLETADFDADSDDVKARLDELDADHADPSVSLDTTDSDEKIAALYAALDTLKTDTAVAKVDVDDRDALAKIAAIQAAERSIGGELKNGQTDPQRLDEMKQQVEGLDASLKNLSADADETSTEVDKVGASSDNAAQKVDNFKKSTDNASSGLGGLMGAAQLLAPALIDIGAVGAVGIAGFATAAATAAVGLGAFAIAAEGDLKSVEAQAKSTITAFQAFNQPIVSPVLTQGIALLGPLLSDLEPLVKGTATALLGLERSGATALGSPFWREFFTFLGGQAGPILSTFGHVIGGVGTALAGLDEAFAPVMQSMLREFNSLGTALTHFGETASSNTGLKSFIAYVQGQAPEVGSILSHVGSDLLMLGEDAARVGPVMLPIINAFAELIGDLERFSPIGVEAAVVALSIGKAFGLLSPVLSSLKDVGSLGGLFSGAMGADEAASGLGKFAASAGNATRNLGDLASAAVNFRGDVFNLGAAAALSSGALDDLGASAATSGAEAATGAGGFRVFQVGVEGAASTSIVAAGEIGAVGDAAIATGDEVKVAAAGLGEMLGPLAAIGTVAAGAIEWLRLYNEQGATTSKTAQQAGTAIGQDFAAGVASSGKSLQTQIGVLNQYVAKIEDAKYKIAGFGNSLSFTGSKNSLAEAAALGVPQAVTEYSRLSSAIIAVKAALSGDMSQQQAAVLLNRALGGTASVSAAELNRQATAAANAGLAAYRAGGQLGGIAVPTSNAAQAAQQLSQSLTNMIGASAGVTNVAAAIDKVNSATTAAQTAMTNFNNALQIDGGNTLDATTANYSLTDALTAVGTAQDTYTTALNKSGTSAATNQQNINALHDSYGTFAAQLRATTDAELANGESTNKIAAANRASVSSFDAKAEATGLSKKSVDALNVSLGLVPLTKSTTLKALGGGTVIQQAHAAEAALRNLVKTYHASVVLDGYSSVLGEISALEGNLVSLNGRTATVHVNTDNTTTDTTITQHESTGGTGGSAGSRIQVAAPRPPGPNVMGIGGVGGAPRPPGLDFAAAVGMGASAAPRGTRIGGTMPTIFDPYPAEIASAQKALAAVRAQIAATASGLESTDSIIPTGTPTTSGAGPGRPGGTTGGGSSIIGTLKHDVAQMKTFNADLHKLAKMGLDRQLLDELIQAGPAAAMGTVQQLLAGGKKEVDQADALQSTLDRNANQIGQLTAQAKVNGKEMGESQIEGWIAGLKKDQRKLEAEIKALLDGTGTSAGGTGEKLSVSLGTSSIRVEPATVTITVNGSTITPKDVTQAVDLGLGQNRREMIRAISQLVGRHP